MHNQRLSTQCVRRVCPQSRSHREEQQPNSGIDAKRTSVWRITLLISSLAVEVIREHLAIYPSGQSLVLKDIRP